MKRRAGFTIVELLIVIVVLAIIAGISTMGYGAMQARGRDAKVRDGASKIAEAIELWSLKGNMLLRDAKAGSGSTMPTEIRNGVTVCNQSSSATSQGWFGEPASVSNYNCGIVRVLTESGMLPNKFLDGIPRNTRYSSWTSQYTYMAYACPAAPHLIILMYSLESPTSRDDTNFNKVVMTQCGQSQSARDTYYNNYGMRGAILINLDRS